MLCIDDYYVIEGFLAWRKAWSGVEDMSVCFWVYS